MRTLSSVDVDQRGEPQPSVWRTRPRGAAEQGAWSPCRTRPPDRGPSTPSGGIFSLSSFFGCRGCRGPCRGDPGTADGLLHVGDGRGAYERIIQYNYVGEGPGCYEQERWQERPRGCPFCGGWLAIAVALLVVLGFRPLASACARVHPQISDFVAAQAGPMLGSMGLGPSRKLQGPPLAPRANGSEQHRLGGATREEPASPRAGPGAPRFDCEAGDAWQWSFDKRLWCCLRGNRTCDRPPPPPSPSSPSSPTGAAGAQRAPVTPSFVAPRPARGSSPKAPGDSAAAV